MGLPGLVSVSRPFGGISLPRGQLCFQQAGQRQELVFEVVVRGKHVGLDPDLLQDDVLKALRVEQGPVVLWSAVELAG